MGTAILLGLVTMALASAVLVGLVVVLVRLAGGADQ